jgi:hypothetical protein
MPVPRNRLFLILSASLMLFSGCAAMGRVDEGILRGYVFTKVKVPCTRDLHASPASPGAAEGKVIQIREPISGYGIYAEFNSNAIGDVALRHGLGEVYFADRELLSILGVWRHRKIHVYGQALEEMP